MPYIRFLIATLSLISGFLILWKIPFASAFSGKKTKSDSLLSIIIPAYNEEFRISPLLQSLQEQTLRPHEIIVVDDYSSDKTGEVAASFAGVTLIKSLDLDDTWIGKSRACWSGVLATTGDLLLFLDADTSLSSPDSLVKLLETDTSLGNRGILCFQPYHTVKRMYEHFSVIFNIIVMAGINVFTPWKNKIPSAGSFGPCILCRREEYFLCGGHEAIRGAVVDDLELGKAFVDNGLPVNCYGGKGLIHFRMYPEGFPQLFEGWTKNFGTASQSTNPFVFALIIAWISGGFSVAGILIHSLIAGSAQMQVLSGIFYIAYMLQFIWLSRRVGDFNPIWMILFFFHHIFFTVLFMWSLFKTKVFKKVKWRGRSIDV